MTKLLSNQSSPQFIFPLNILLIENQPLVFPLLDGKKEKNYELITATDLSEGESLCHFSQIDIIIINDLLVINQLDDFVNTILECSQNNECLQIILLTNNFTQSFQIVSNLEHRLINCVNQIEVTSIPLESLEQKLLIANKNISISKQNRWLLEQNKIVENIYSLTRQSSDLSANDLSANLTTIAQQLRSFLAVHQVVFCQFDRDNEDKIIAQSNTDSQLSSNQTIIASEYFPDSDLSEYKQVKVYEVENRQSLPLESKLSRFLAQFNLNSCLILPLLYQPIDRENEPEKIWGLLLLEETQHTRTWRPCEVDFISSLSIPIATLIEHNQLRSGVISINRSNQSEPESISTEKLAQQKLFEKYLEEKNKLENDDKTKTKNLFLANMSHELRTPINSIIGMLDILNGSVLSTEQSYQVSLARNNAESLLQTISDILDFAKIEAGNLKLDIKEFDLNETLSHFAQQIATQAHNKGLEFILDLPNINDTNTIVKGDRTRILQILDNLIHNAIKFTEEGEILLRSTLKQCPDNENELLLSTIIQDTGIGIPDDGLDILFDRFTEIDVGSAEKYKGTGLGLAITKKLCELMGGSISVQSKLNQGTFFYFQIKLQPTTQNVFETSPPNFDNLNILVVDTNDTARQVLASQLERWGIQVTQAFSSKSAWDLCQQVVHDDKNPINESITANQSSHPQFDAIIIDQSIRFFGSLMFSEKLLQTPELQNLLIITMSKDNSSYLKNNQKNLNLVKPIKQNDLFKILLDINKKKKILQAQSIDQKVSREVNKPANNSGSNEENNYNFTNSRVLIVEDNKVNQLVIKGLLKKHQIKNIDIAHNGLKAIKLLNQTTVDDTYDLILMDCLMPEMDGYTATTIIRQGQAGEHNQNIPIIAMTANTLEGDEEKCLQVGMNDYLGKPVNKNTFATKLEKFLAVNS